MGEVTFQRVFVEDVKTVKNVEVVLSVFFF